MRGLLLLSHILVVDVVQTRQFPMAAEAITPNGYPVQDLLMEDSQC
jgi:hypothetical protein